MNLAHRWLCRSAYWRNTVKTYILPWVLDDLDIGTNVLEVGPGPGVTTDLLRGRVERLTCVEIDRGFADSLSQRMSGHNVTVVRQDATAMSFSTARIAAPEFHRNYPSTRDWSWATLVLSHPCRLETGE
jgi:16S rRNA A1518/A1519 N6-dimethyltransferase RsmA/KsgA/DIM1 with predicted DNA glycosylase/AP lyase activity